MAIFNSYFDITRGYSLVTCHIANWKIPISMGKSSFFIGHGFHSHVSLLEGNLYVIPRIKLREEADVNPTQSCYETPWIQTLRYGKACHHQAHFASYGWIHGVYIYIYQYILSSYPSYSRYIPMIIHQIPRNSSSETGWWLKKHLEKYEFVSWDDDPTNEMENNPFMFETTNQILIIINHH